MKTKLIDKLAFLFKQVEVGNIPAYKALNNFLLEFGGKQIWLPEKVYTKKEVIVKAYNSGMVAKVIARKFDISINYVYATISEHNGAEFRKRVA